MATNKVYGAINTAGGTEGALDTVKYAVLSDGDLAIVCNSAEETHIFRFESSSAAAESDPQVIKPDDAGSNNGRWILTDMSIEDLKTYGNAVFDGTVAITGATTVAALTASGLITANTLKIGAGATIDEVDDDDTLAAASDTKLCTQGNVKAYVDAAAGGIVMSYDFFAGYLRRPWFTYSSTSVIVFSSARYHHDGTTEQIVKCDSGITYTFGSGGSNADSDDLDSGSSRWQYLYLDDSAIVTAGTNVLTASEFVNSETAPIYSAAKLGFYNGNDRCIFAVRLGASDNILEFFHEGEFVQYGDRITSRTTSDLDTTWEDVTLILPSFSRMGQATFILNASLSSSSARAYWRTNGQTSTNGHVLSYASSSTIPATDHTQIVVTDTSQVIEVKYSSTGFHQMGVVTDGWFFPNRGI